MASQSSETQNLQYFQPGRLASMIMILIIIMMIIMIIITNS